MRTRSLDLSSGAFGPGYRDESIPDTEWAANVTAWTKGLAWVLAAAPRGSELHLPAGFDLFHDNTVIVQRSDLHLTGTGRLVGTDWRNAGFILDGVAHNNVSVTDVDIDGWQFTISDPPPTSTPVGTTPAQHGLTFEGAHRCRATDIVVTGFWGAGIATGDASSDLEVIRPRIERVRGAAVWNGVGSHHLTYRDVVSINPGDDGFCNDSGDADNDPVSDVLLDGFTFWGADPVGPGAGGISNLGSRRCRHRNLTIRHSPTAALRVTADELSTAGAAGNTSEVSFVDATIVGSSWRSGATQTRRSRADNGAIMVWSNVPGSAITDTTFAHIDVIATSPAAPKDVQIAGRNGGTVTGVLLHDVHFDPPRHGIDVAGEVATVTRTGTTNI